MPRVPEAEHTVQATGLPSVRLNAGITPEAYGAGIGRGLQAVSGALGQYAEQKRQEQDTALLMGAESKLQQWQNQRLFTPETGEYAQRGQAAFGAIERTMPEWDKQVSTLESTMSDRQKLVFRERASNMRNQMERDLMRHVGQQAETYQQSETAALVQTRINTAALYATDPERFDKELREAQGAFLVGSPGLGPQAQKVGLQRIESSARSIVVDKLMRDDPLAAQRYYNQWRDQFTAEDGGRIEALLDPATDQAAGEAAAKSFLSGGAVPGIGANYTPNDEQASEIAKAAQELGVDPVDLATVISYETGGTMSPGQKGPVTHRGQHIGLIQFGDAEQQAYGAHAGQTFAEQMPAVVRYLKARGVKPGMGLLDLYSTVNAGSPGRYGAKDGNTADATVADKVSGRAMAEHRKKAEAMFTRGGAAMSSPESAAAATAPRSYTDALQLAAQMPAGRTRDAAISYIQTQQALERTREAETEKAMTAEINSAVEQAPIGSSFAKIVTPQQLAYAQSHGLIASYEARLRQRAAGEDHTTPPDLLLAYRDVASKAFAGDKAAQRELLSYNPYDPKMPMAMQDRDWLDKTQQTLRSGTASEKANAATEGEINTIIKQHTVSNLGIPEKQIGTGTEQGQRAFKFYNDLRTWADQFQREKKRPPSYQEVQQRADEMTLTFTREQPGMLWGTNTVTSNVFDLDIPPATLTEITTLLRQSGQPVTGANVAHVYKNMLKQKATQ